MCYIFNTFKCFNIFKFKIHMKNIIQNGYGKYQTICTFRTKNEVSNSTYTADGRDSINWLKPLKTYVS